MTLHKIKEHLDKELEKIGQKTSTCMSDQELLGKILCNYEYVERLIEEESDKYIYGMRKSGHSMRDKEIATLEEKLENASSDYEKDFYKRMIRFIQDYR